MAELEILQSSMHEREVELKHVEGHMERATTNAFREVGHDLAYIRDKKLFLCCSESFEQYVVDRWEMSVQRAQQLIDAAKVYNQLESTIVDGLSTIVDKPVLPTRETHIRPLLKLKPEQRTEVWQRVLSSENKVTAKVVQSEVERKLAEIEKNWITLSEWEEMDNGAQASVLNQPAFNKKEFNSVNENIEWAAWSWNPITGCLHNCAYCYARDIANRFYPQLFEPSFIPERLTAPRNTRAKKPRWSGDTGHVNVFTCSMADLFGKWVPDAWIRSVLSVIEENPQWNFLLLTKFPIRMAEFDYPNNVWLGTSVDYQWAVERAENAFTTVKESGFGGVCWLSCEPMMERLTFSSLDMFDWVVMGGSSKSTQTPEYKPPFEDILHLHSQARVAGCLVYQKTNLIPGMTDEQRIREYPK